MELAVGDDSFRSNVPTRSPEKRKRKSNKQRSVRSEYAPPIKTSSDHLVASNPFDDDYSVSTPLAHEKINKPRYSSTADYRVYRMPLNMPPRPASPLPASPLPPSPNREQQLHYQQMSTRRAYDRTDSFKTAAQDTCNPSLLGTGLDQTITFPGQHFRSNYPERVQTSESLNLSRLRAPHGSPKGKLNFNVHMETINPSAPTQNHFRGPRTYSSYVVHHRKEMSNDFSDTDDFHSPTAELQPVNPRRPCSPKLARADVSSHEKCNQWLFHAAYSGHMTRGPLYPCGICSGDVDDVKDAIMCEASCQKWFHRTCTGLTELAHTLLTADATAIWGCDTCMAKKNIKLVQIKP